MQRQNCPECATPIAPVMAQQGRTVTYTYTCPACAATLPTRTYTLVYQAPARGQQVIDRALGQVDTKLSPTNIGGQIRQLRRMLGVSAADLGEQVGVSRSAIEYWEAGQTNANGNPKAQRALHYLFELGAKRV